MNVNRINSMPQYSFRGQIVTVGDWDKKLKSSFVNHFDIQELSEENTVIGLMKSKKSFLITNPDDNYGKKYKLELKIKKDNPSIFDKIKNLLSLNKVNITDGYHSSTGMISIIERTCAIRIAIEKLKGLI